MSKKMRSRQADGKHADRRDIARGEATGSVPLDWVETRAALENKYYFRVRKWYFAPLVVLAVALFLASFLFDSVWLALIAATLAIALSKWNKRARKASMSTARHR